MFYSCFDCHKVSPLLEEVISKCPLCGSKNGEAISSERVNEGLKSGAMFNIDPRTGKRSKKKVR